MKRILLLVPLIAFLSCGGDSEISPGDTFIKYFGGDGNYELKDMILREDGEGVVMLGDLISNDSIRFHLVSTDGDGNQLTATDLSQIHPRMEPSRITAVPGVGYLVIGTGNDGGTDKIVWSYLDNDFNQLDATGQAISKPEDGWNVVEDMTDIINYRGVDIGILTADNAVLITGYTDELGSNDFYFEKMGGLSDWVRIQERAVSDDQLVRALFLLDGTIALFGQTDAISDDGETGVNVLRMIIDQEGVLQNSATYGMSDGDDRFYDDVMSDVIEKPGGFGIVGTSDIGSGVEVPFLMSVDLIGAATSEILFAQDVVEEFGSPFESEPKASGGRGYGITQTNSNDFILVGELLDFYDQDKNGNRTTSRNNELMVMRTNQGGERIGNFNNFGVVNGADKAVRVLTATDGSILVGATYDFGNDFTQFALLKMNIDGELKQ